MTPVPLSLPRSLSRAFTLVELLTVIAIIGLLAGILVPVVSKVRQSADNAQCLSALRQDGLALQLYINDRRDQKLPGPLYGQVIPITRLSGGEPANGHLFSYLAPYLSTKATSATQLLPDEFLCHGWLRNVRGDWQENRTPVYVLNISVPVLDSTWKQNPWGNAGSSSKTYSYPEILSANEAPKTWAMRDLDALNTAGSGTTLPEKPVHGDHRNQLYFDWHVGPVSVTGS